MPQPSPTHRPEGRWRSAWQVFLGRRTTPLQIEAEWLEYKLVFEDILTRLGAQLARVAKAEKKRLDVQLEPPQLDLEPQGTSKQALRVKISRMRGVPRVRGRGPAQPNGTLDLEEGP